MASDDHIKPMPSLIPGHYRTIRRWFFIASIVGAAVILASWTVPALVAWDKMYLVRFYAFMPILLFAAHLAIARDALIEKLRMGPPSFGKMLAVMPLLIIAGIAALAVCIFVVWGQSPVSKRFLEFLPIAVVGPVGVAFVVHGAWQRRGSERFCPQCGYRYGYEGQDEHLAPDKCSECGLLWKPLLITGRPRVGFGSIGLGLAILLGLMVGSGVWLVAMHKVLPASVVRAVVPNEPSSSILWFHEAAADLPVEDVQRITDRLIAERRKTGSWGSVFGWLDEQSNRKALRNDQIVAIVEIDTASLAVTPIAGGRFRITRNQGNASVGALEMFYFAGFRAEDGAWQWLPRTAISASQIATGPTRPAGGSVHTLPGDPAAYDGKKVTIRLFQFIYAGSPETTGIPSIVNGELTSPTPPLYLKRHEFMVEFPAVGPGAGAGSPALDRQ